MVDLTTYAEDLKHQLLNQFTTNQAVDFQVSITADSLDWINFEVRDYISKGVCIEPHDVPNPLSDVTVFTIPQLHKINCFVEDYIRKLHRERRCLR